jgi:hypothetical protein
VGEIRFCNPMHRQTRNPGPQHEDLRKTPCYRRARNLAFGSNLRLEEPPDSDAPVVFVIVFSIIESSSSQVSAAAALKRCGEFARRVRAISGAEI